jgi:DNA replication and repair protein RecF
MGEHRLFDLESIEVWDAQMAKLGVFIHEKRKTFLNSFIPVFQKFYHEIGKKDENISIDYKSQLSNGDFAQLLIEYHKKDSYAQYSNAGIHKDDLIFNIKGHPIKKFGSQGQQKSFIIALRLAQFDWLKMQKKTNPILLLDDIFDKLDAQRVQKLVALVTQDYFGQVMVSDTDEERMKALLESLTVPSKLFKVTEGDVTEISG